jgi:hypothetical protein
LQHYRFAVAVDHDAGRPSDPHGRAAPYRWWQKMRAQRNRARQFRGKRRVDGALLPVPHARTMFDAIARGHREKSAVAADFDGVAGLRVPASLPLRPKTPTGGGASTLSRPGLSIV